MDDIIDNQREAGEISGIIPSSGWGYGEWLGPVWDAVMFIIPNALYDYYGESRSIERLYPTMLRYLDYLKTKEKDGYLPLAWVTGCIGKLRRIMNIPLPPTIIWIIS